MNNLIAAIEALRTHNNGVNNISVNRNEAIDLINTHMAGKVIVPVEPTKEMIAASDGIMWTDDTDQNSRNQYKAMLSVGSGVDVAGMVSVPMEQLQDICFAIHNPDFVKAMSGGDILLTSLKAVEQAMLSTIAGDE